MKIGIIGTGQIGTAVGTQWTKATHQVMFGSRSPEKALALAREMGTHACGGSYAEAARFGDVLLLAVPYAAAEETLGLMGALAGKVLIDATNPIGAGMALTIGFSTSAAEEIARLAPGARVVKAFNAIFASVIQEGGHFGDQRAAGFYCGDDAEAKQLTAALVRDCGFEPVDAGPLAHARYLEPMAALIVALGYGQGMGNRMALTLLKR